MGTNLPFVNDMHWFNSYSSCFKVLCLATGGHLRSRPLSLTFCHPPSPYHPTPLQWPDQLHGIWRSTVWPQLWPTTVVVVAPPLFEKWNWDQQPMFLFTATVPMCQCALYCVYSVYCTVYSTVSHQQWCRVQAVSCIVRQLLSSNPSPFSNVWKANTWHCSSRTSPPSSFQEKGFICFLTWYPHNIIWQYLWKSRLENLQPICTDTSLSWGAYLHPQGAVFKQCKKNHHCMYCQYIIYMCNYFQHIFNICPIIFFLDIAPDNLPTSHLTLAIGLEVNVDDVGDLVGQGEEVVVGLVHQVALSSQSVTFLLLVLKDVSSIFNLQLVWNIGRAKLQQIGQKQLWRLINCGNLASDYNSHPSSVASPNYALQHL